MATSATKVKTRQVAMSATATAYDKAGLPFPIYDGKPTPTHDRNAWDVKVGVLTHKVIGEVAPRAQGRPFYEVRTLIAEAVGRVVTGRSLGRLDRARMR